MTQINNLPRQNCTFAERRLQRYNKNIDFLDSCSTNFLKSKKTHEFCEWSDTVTIKLDASDNTEKEYKDTFGLHFLDEKTLIIGDNMNNVILVYQDDNKVVTQNITPLIHVKNRFRFDENCILHKQIEPAQVPPHIHVHLQFIQNNIQNNTVQNNIHNNTVQNNIQSNTIHNTFNDLQISSPQSTHINSLELYLETHFKKGGMCPIKQFSKHAGWKKEYKNLIETRRMDICKSCHKRWLKGCCHGYGRNNRTQWVMVVDWHEEGS